MSPASECLDITMKRRAKHEPDRVLDPVSPLKETIATERAEAPMLAAAAKAANKLPREEQLKSFQANLVAHDGGNQP
jgi:hypothetical protein